MIPLSDAQGWSAYDPVGVANRILLFAGSAAGGLLLGGNPLFRAGVALLAGAFGASCMGWRWLAWICGRIGCDCDGQP